MFHGFRRGRNGPPGSEGPARESQPREAPLRREDETWFEYHATRGELESGEGTDLIRRLTPVRGVWGRRPDQMLWDKLEQDVSLYQQCLQRPDLLPEDRGILELCGAKLELTRKCLDRRKRWPFAFWHLTHEVDGLLLLVLPEDLLASRALEVVDTFERNVVDPVLRRLWLGDGAQGKGPLIRVVQQLLPETRNASDPPFEPLALRRCRCVLQGALGVVNSQTNLGFWQLSKNVLIQIVSGIVLLVLLAALSLVTVLTINLALPFWEGLVYFLAGMIGAAVANMLSKDAFQVVQGATLRWYLYYLFLKPLIGGFAALFFYLVQYSGFLLEVRSPDKTGGSTPFVQINVDGAPQRFLVLLALAIVAGAFADRVLSSTMERVLQKMLISSEKSPITGASKGASVKS